MNQRDALEAICAGLVKAVLGATSAPRVQPQRRRRKAALEDGRGRATRTATAEQLPLELRPGPSPVPEFGDGAVAPPFTQREYELMEARLRGEGPRDTYLPESGQEPWKG